MCISCNFVFHVFLELDRNNRNWDYDNCFIVVLKQNVVHIFCVRCKWLIIKILVYIELVLILVAKGFGGGSVAFSFMAVLIYSNLLQFIMQFGTKTN